jgi:hypothetical protein
MQVRGPCLAAIGLGAPSSRPTSNDIIGGKCEGGVSTRQQSYGDGGVAPSRGGGAEMGSRVTPLGRTAPGSTRGPSPCPPMRRASGGPSGGDTGRFAGDGRGYRTHRVEHAMPDRRRPPLVSTPGVSPQATNDREAASSSSPNSLPSPVPKGTDREWRLVRPPSGFVHSSACPWFRGPFGPRPSTSRVFVARRRTPPLFAHPLLSIRVSFRLRPYSRNKITRLSGASMAAGSGR